MDSAPVVRFFLYSPPAPTSSIDAEVNLMRSRIVDTMHGEHIGKWAARIEQYMKTPAAYSKPTASSSSTSSAATAAASVSTFYRVVMSHRPQYSYIVWKTNCLELGNPTKTSARDSQTHIMPYSAAIASPAFADRPLSSPWAQALLGAPVASAADVGPTSADLLAKLSATTSPFLHLFSDTFKLIGRRETSSAFEGDEYLLPAYDVSIRLLTFRYSQQQLASAVLIGIQLNAVNAIEEADEFIAELLLNLLSPAAFRVLVMQMHQMSQAFNQMSQPTTHAAQTPQQSSQQTAGAAASSSTSSSSAPSATQTSAPAASAGSGGSSASALAPPPSLSPLAFGIVPSVHCSPIDVLLSYFRRIAFFPFNLPNFYTNRHTAVQIIYWANNASGGANVSATSTTAAAAAATSASGAAVPAGGNPSLPAGLPLAPQTAVANPSSANVVHR